MLSLFYAPTQTTMLIRCDCSLDIPVINQNSHKAFCSYFTGANVSQDKNKDYFKKS